MSGSRVLAIVGAKDSGKTTLLEGLIGQLTRRGYRVGSVKHSHHSGSPDRPETDTWRHAYAGASPVFLVGRDYTMQVQRTSREPRPQELAAMCPELDLLLLEGFTDSPVARIEVVGRGEALRSVGQGPLLAVAAADPEAAQLLGADVPIFCRDDLQGLAELVLTRCLPGSPEGGDADG